MRGVLKFTNIPPDRPTRPGCRARLVTLGLAVLALVQAGLALRALRVPPELAAQVSLSLPLEFVGGLLWAGVFVLLVVGRWLRQVRARRLTAPVLVVFALYNGGRWLIFTEADYDRGRLPFLLLATFLFILFLVVFSARPWRRRQPQETEITSDDPEPQN